GTLPNKHMQRHTSTVRKSEHVAPAESHHAGSLHPVPRPFHKVCSQFGNTHTICPDFVSAHIQSRSPLRAGSGLAFVPACESLPACRAHPNAHGFSGFYPASNK